MRHSVIKAITNCMNGSMNTILSLILLTILDVVWFLKLELLVHQFVLMSDSIEEIITIFPTTVVELTFLFRFCHSKLHASGPDNLNL